MTFKVYSMHSEEYKPLHDITWPGKEAYAKRHGYNCVDGQHITSDPKRIPWERVEQWHFHLMDNSWLFFTGCDAMITNPRVTLESLITNDADFIFCVDGCGLQSDSWLMRNCPATFKFLENVMKWEGKLDNEQDAMSLELSGEKILSNFMANFPPRLNHGQPASPATAMLLQNALNHSSVRCKILPQPALNAYPLDYYLGSGQGTCWIPGSFICHLPGKSMNERIHIFKELKERHQIA